MIGEAVTGLRKSQDKIKQHGETVRVVIYKNKISRQDVIDAFDMQETL